MISSSKTSAPPPAAPPMMISIGVLSVGVGDGSVAVGDGGVAVGDGSVAVCVYNTFCKSSIRRNVFNQLTTSEFVHSNLHFTNVQSLQHMLLGCHNANNNNNRNSCVVMEVRPLYKLIKYLQLCSWHQLGEFGLQRFIIIV